MLDVVKGATTSHVRIDIGGATVTASITNESVGDLRIAKGLKVTAVVKSADVTVAVHDCFGPYFHGLPSRERTHANFSLNAC